MAMKPDSPAHMGRYKTFRATQTYERIASRDPETYRANYVNEQFDVEIIIDVVALLNHLGRKAAHNRSGKSAIQGGMIKATAKRS